MTITIVENENGIFAKDRDGKLMMINGLMILKDDRKEAPAFYKPGTKFFKLACPIGTKHKAEHIDKNFVNLY